MKNLINAIILIFCIVHILFKFVFTGCIMFIGAAALASGMPITALVLFSVGIAIFDCLSDDESDINLI